MDKYYEFFSKATSNIVTVVNFLLTRIYFPSSLRRMNLYQALVTLQSSQYINMLHLRVSRLCLMDMVPTSSYVDIVVIPLTIF